MTTLEQAKANVVAEVESTGLDPRWVAAGGALLGGLYVAGLTGVSAGKVVGTLAGAAASYYGADKIMEEYSGDNSIEMSVTTGSIGILVGMLSSGAGGCFDRKRDENGVF